MGDRAAATKDGNVDRMALSTGTVDHDHRRNTELYIRTGRSGGARGLRTTDGSPRRVRGTPRATV
ncbi:hypothetical protein J2751_001682 [Halorubrum alkaliphilum]|uniref:Uncharacterized protein n=1 Tax=Halorubrum alkaliphilum TaxID=261290 RepID=A0A8T4GG08_9EURY|nr:hypothetical protein [Halorubrum alkaliphilum]